MRPSSKDLEEMVVPWSLEMSFVGSSRLADKGELDALLEKLAEHFMGVMGEAGHKVWLKSAGVRPMTQEELLAVVPRKVHMAVKDGSRQICKTQYVSVRNLTADRDKVTCQLCRREMARE